MKFLKLNILILLTLLAASCGDPVVELEDVDYEPRISVEGFLFVGNSVKDIKIMRNFELEKEVEVEQLYLTPEKNNVKASINGIELQFDEENKTYFNNSITVEHDKSYSLEITAEVMGKSLSTEGTTTTPSAGFHIAEDSLGNIVYGEDQILLRYKTSPNSNFFGFSIMALDASVDNFIYENSLFPNLEPEDVEDNFNQYLFQSRIFSNLDPSYTGYHIFRVENYDAWFYSRYRVIGYAGDDNFRSFVFTAKNVQEFDGNFHEPKNPFSDDGIGVFGSAIADTMYFNLVKTDK